MLVSHIIKEKDRELVSVAAEAPLSEVVQLLHKHRIGAAFVLQPDGRLAGVLSERDVVTALAKDGEMALKRSAHIYMARDTNTCTQSDGTEDIVDAMARRHLRYVPVVDNDREVGMVSIGDVVKSFVADAECQSREMRDIIRDLNALS